MMSQSCRAPLIGFIARPCFSCHSSILSQVEPLTALPLRAFSTSPVSQRVTRDRNPNRGVSPLRRTGLRQRLSVDKYPLPEPVLDVKARQEQVEVDKDHGLWDFFNQKRARITFGVDESTVGRSWSIPELRVKSWEDLHKLWWISLKDCNRIATSLTERSRLGVRHGQGDLEERMATVKRTQKHIKWVLTERWYAWEAARKVAATDPSVDLTGEGGAYKADFDDSSPFMSDYSSSIQAGRQKTTTI